MRNHKSLHRRHGRKAKIISGQTRLSIWAGIPLIHMELQDDTPKAKITSGQTQFDAGRYSDTSYAFTNDYYQEAGAFFTRTDNTLLDIQNTQAEHGRLLEQQQKQNQDHATAVQELRQDTATMNDNITTMMPFWNIE